MSFTLRRRMTDGSEVPIKMSIVDAFAPRKEGKRARQWERVRSTTPTHGQASTSPRLTELCLFISSLLCSPTLLDLRDAMNPRDEEEAAADALFFSSTPLLGASLDLVSFESDDDEQKVIRPPP